jgi:hypothetical protein
MEKDALKCHEKNFQPLALWKRDYLGSDRELDPELFAGEVGSGSRSKPQSKMGSRSGSTTLDRSLRYQENVWLDNNTEDNRVR